MVKAKLLGFDKPDKHKTDVTIINEVLPFPTKELEMSVEEWIARRSPKEIEHHPSSPPAVATDRAARADRLRPAVELKTTPASGAGG